MVKMNLQYFPMHVTGETNVKQWYKVLCKYYHPDVPGGDNEIMQLINQEYKALISNNYQYPQQLPAKNKFVVGIGNKNFDLNDDDGVIDLIAHVIKQSRK